MADSISNRSGLNIDLCDDPMIVMSNEVEVSEIILTLQKTASCEYFITGGTITFCTKINNSSDIEIDDIRWFDDLDPRLSYIADTFLVDGTAATPIIIDQELSYMIETIAPGQSMLICFKVLVGAPTP